jgi:hypothetical protein
MAKRWQGTIAKQLDSGCKAVAKRSQRKDKLMAEPLKAIE